MPRILRSKQFWIGTAVGAFVVPVVLGKVAPRAAQKLPG